MFAKVTVPEAHGLYATGLGLLGSPRLASASLALPAPATTAAALSAARPPKAAGLLLRGAGNASEADPRRGKPSKARQGETAGLDLALAFPGPAWPSSLYLALGPLYGGSHGPIGQTFPWLPHHYRPCVGYKIDMAMY